MAGAQYRAANSKKVRSMRLWERFKAWRRGERMLKGVNRGRCFEKKESGGGFSAKAQPKIEVTAKIIRADGTEEKL